MGDGAGMTGLAMIWLSTIVTTATTAVLFVLLAQWSAGGAAPWSIVPGLVRGIREWGHREDELEPFRFVSPMAEIPEAPIEFAALSPGQFGPSRHVAQPGTEDRAARDAPADVEIEELGSRRI